MSDTAENPSQHLNRLHVLSKNVSDAINEIFSMAYAQTQEMVWVPRTGSDPDIKLVEKSLWINRIMIPLGTRQKTLNLMQAFFRRDCLALSKAEILDAVYGPLQERSPRFTAAQEGNLTKLLSRTRTFLEESLAHSYFSRPIDWLVFDVKTRKYYLYKVRSDMDFAG